jgi:hypothetical protein
MIKEYAMKAAENLTFMMIDDDFDLCIPMICETSIRKATKEEKRALYEIISSALYGMYRYKDIDITGCLRYAKKNAYSKMYKLFPMSDPVLGLLDIWYTIDRPLEEFYEIYIMHRKTHGATLHRTIEQALNADLYR